MAIAVRGGLSRTRHARVTAAGRGSGARCLVPRSAWPPPRPRACWASPRLCALRSRVCAPVILKPPSIRPPACRAPRRGRSPGGSRPTPFQTPQERGRVPHRSPDPRRRFFLAPAARSLHFGRAPRAARRLEGSGGAATGGSRGARNRAGRARRKRCPRRLREIGRAPECEAFARRLPRSARAQQYSAAPAARGGRGAPGGGGLSARTGGPIPEIAAGPAAGSPPGGRAAGWAAPFPAPRPAFPAAADRGGAPGPAMRGAAGAGPAFGFAAECPAGGASGPPRAGRGLPAHGADPAGRLVEVGNPEPRGPEPPPHLLRGVPPGVLGKVPVEVRRDALLERDVLGPPALQEVPVHEPLQVV